jgi:tRNA threonylcarbamoyladenosine biosynthesis protein TsaE
MAARLPSTLLIHTESSDETRAVGRRLGESLNAGDVVCLVGDLGAGKTTLTQGIAIGLGIPEDVVVNSPTFTILAEHPEGRFPLYHWDVYRLAGAGDMYDLAFDEYLDGSGVVVVEWADRIAAALPEDVLMICLTDAGPISRRLDLTATGPSSNGLMARFQEARV